MWFNILLNIKKSSMDYKKELKKSFQNGPLLLQHRYLASRNVFMYMSFLFFLNYFFVWAKFFDTLFINTLPYMYVWFLLTFMGFIYFFLWKAFSPNSFIRIWILWILIVLFGISMYPIF